MLQKTYTVDILEKKRRPNNGVLAKYYLEGSHEPIISKEAFARVQAEMVRRASLFSEGKKRVYSSKYALFSIVVCGNCGDIYRRIKWNNHGVKSTVWRCVSRVEKDGPECSARTIKEEVLQLIVVMAINQAWNSQGEVLPILEQNIRNALSGKLADRVSAINKELEKCQKDLLAAGTNITATQEIGKQILSLRNEKQGLMIRMASDREKEMKVTEMMDFLKQQEQYITEYSETLARRLIERLTVFDDRVVVEFKSGISTEVLM